MKYELKINRDPAYDRKSTPPDPTLLPHVANGENMFGLGDEAAEVALMQSAHAPITAWSGTSRFRSLAG
ncbi:hypothetical protein [Nocardia sp. NPDC052566]|uniref:hypothetical protein n=1 Tax=Nocardia sp. NPDC052566 TaxID=3364330 RepID=UPI0037C8A71F